MPPEYIERYEITSKYDVFSLGVVIVRIMAGDEGYSKCAHMSSQEFIEHVHENWGKRLRETMSSYISEQVSTCLEIALRCVEVDCEKRPTIAEIVGELNKVDTAESSPKDKVTNRRSKHSLNQNTNSERRGRIVFSATGPRCHSTSSPALSCLCPSKMNSISLMACPTTTTAAQSLPLH